MYITVSAAADSQQEVCLRYFFRMLVVKVLHTKQGTLKFAEICTRYFFGELYIVHDERLFAQYILTVFSGSEQ
jgi:hypothetical protein